MKNVLLIISALLLLVPASFAWDTAECDAVGWVHPDCSWGPIPPQDSSSSHHTSVRRGGGDAGSWVKTFWVFDSSEELGSCWDFHLERPGVRSVYHKALVVPPLHWNGSAQVNSFPEVKKALCTPEKPSWYWAEVPA